MPRYKLRTLLILLALLPPLLAWWGWPTMQRILWPPKPRYRLTFTVLSVDSDFAFPIAVPPQAESELLIIESESGPDSPDAAPAAPSQ
jgi:hypothetical protein